MSKTPKKTMSKTPKKTMSKTPKKTETETPETEENPEAGEATTGTAGEDAAESEAQFDAERDAAQSDDGPDDATQFDTGDAAADDDAAADQSPWNLDPAERVAVLETEAEENKDKLLRALAEAENVRRRAVREKADAAKYAIANFAREMLTVGDNLRRALDSVPEDGRQESPVVENLILGVEMTAREMLNAFERTGIEPIEAKGKRFDHNLHEAMFEVEDKSVPAGTVVQELETGFTLNGRLLRPARVGIAKGGPKAATDPAGDGDPAPSGDRSAEGQDAYERRVDADKPSDSGTQVDTEL